MVNHVSVRLTVKDIRLIRSFLEERIDEIEYGVMKNKNKRRMKRIIEYLSMF